MEASRLLAARAEQVREVHAEAALEIAAMHDGDIHLLITDVVMPEKSGFELAHDLKAVRPGVKVLFMSGYTDGRIGGSWVLTPETQFVQKPFTEATLTRKIREALGDEVEINERYRGLH